MKQIYRMGLSLLISLLALTQTGTSVRGQDLEEKGKSGPTEGVPKRRSFDDIKMLAAKSGYIEISRSDPDKNGYPDAVLINFAHSPKYWNLGSKMLSAMLKQGDAFYPEGFDDNLDAHIAATAKKYGLTDEFGKWVYGMKKNLSSHPYHKFCVQLKADSKATLVGVDDGAVGAYQTVIGRHYRAAATKAVAAKFYRQFISMSRERTDTIAEGVESNIDKSPGQDYVYFGGIHLGLVLHERGPVLPEKLNEAGKSFQVISHPELEKIIKADRDRRK